MRGKGRSAYRMGEGCGHCGDISAEFRMGEGCGGSSKEFRRGIGWSDVSMRCSRGEGVGLLR